MEATTTEVAWNGATEGLRGRAWYKYGPAIDDSNKVFKLGDLTRSWLFTSDMATYTAITLGLIFIGARASKYING